MKAFLHSGKWLVAVSAGPDSMALLDMCQREGISVVCAHVNYHHQAQAEEEEAYLRSYCKDRDLEIRVRNESFEPVGNFEAEARKWRYDFFRSLIQTEHYNGVLVAHQQDDVIETFLMQQEKGIVPETWGLNDDVRMNGVRIVRPLLDYTKQQLTDYCQLHNIRYYLDETNDSDDYRRNEIRHTMVEPMSAFERTMVLKEIDALNAEWKERRCRVRTEIREASIEKARYLKLESVDRLTLLRMFLENGQTSHYSEKHLKEIDGLIQKEEDLEVILKDFRLVNDNGKLKKVKPATPYRYTFTTKEELKNVSCEAFRVIEGRPGVYAVTLRDDDFPVVIRNWNDGDSIAMRFGTKSVHRFFIDRHIPKYLRKTWPIMENRDRCVILVPGLGCDVTHYSIKPDFSVLQYENMEESSHE